MNKKILKGIELTNYKFINKPLVVGGLALEYYNIRETTHDYDYMVSPSDWLELKKIHPDKINLFGGKHEKDVDATINLTENPIDLISTLFQFNYNSLVKNSIDFPEYKIISITNLLLTKTLGAVYNKDPKSINDQKLIVDKIVELQYN
tara:strand:+ start:1256 stop:1699 length:444 start_codon:yes stop_codon:yes gene_type:complete